MPEAVRNSVQKRRQVAALQRFSESAVQEVPSQKGKQMLVNETHTLDQATVNRRTKERRDNMDRRTNETSSFAGGERRQTSRRTVERRRQIDPTTCERDYSADEIEFMTAMDDYKRRSGRQFPTWSEVLEVVRSLGYRQVMEPTTLEF